MEPLELRDSMTITGVDSPSRVMATGDGGRILLKKDNDSLYLFDIEMIRDMEIVFERPQFLYRDCQIFDISFVSHDVVCVVLQKPITCDLFICEVELDVENKKAVIIGDIHDTRMKVERHRKVIVTQDEEDCVLISCPIKFSKSSENKVELFPCSKYLKDHSGGKITFNVVYNEKEVLVDNPFISRNHLYLFDQLDYNRLIVFPISGSQCGKAYVRSTKGTAPSGKFMIKCSQVFEEFVLVYACAIQEDRKTRGTKPNMFMMDLNSLSYRPLNLTLTHHFPNGKVSFKKSGETTVYLHGDCNMVTCGERMHLYQIDIMALQHLRRAIPSRSTSSISDGSSMTSSMSSLATVTSNTPVTTAVANTQSPPTPPPRYEKRRSRMRDRGMMKERTKSLGCLSQILQNEEPTSPVKRVPSLHWSSAMAEEGQTTLRDQLRDAKEMGFSDEVIMKALTMNALGGENSQELRAFENTNIMLDMLHQAAAQMNDKPKLKLSVYNGETSSRSDRPSSSNRGLLTPRSASVSRSSSLNLGSSSPSRSSHRSDSHDINRLISTLDREQERTRKEVDMQFARLGEKIRNLETQLHDEKTEKERAQDLHRDMSERLKEEEQELQRERQEADKLRDESTELKTCLDRLTIEALRHQKELQDQKELAEYRKRQHDLQMDTKNAEIVTLQNELSARDRVANERTDIEERIRRLEEENRRLQSQISSHDVSDIERERCEAILARDELREKISVLEGQVAKCCICLEEKPSIVFFPCLHVCACDGCYRNRTISTCPTCRAKIVGNVKIFF